MALIDLAKLQKDIKLLTKCLEERWIPARDGKTVFAHSSCALCREYPENECYDIKDINRCPIAEKTGLCNCHDTPYQECLSNYAMLQLHIKMKMPKLQPEIDFLSDLLKKLKKERDNEYSNYK